MERRIFRYYCSTQVFISAVRFVHRIDGVMLQFCRSGVLTGLTGWGSSVGKQVFLEALRAPSAASASGDNAFPSSLPLSIYGSKDSECSLHTSLL